MKDKFSGANYWIVTHAAKRYSRIWHCHLINRQKKSQSNDRPMVTGCMVPLGWFEHPARGLGKRPSALLPFSVWFSFFLFSYGYGKRAKYAFRLFLAVLACLLYNYYTVQDESCISKSRSKTEPPGLSRGLYYEAFFTRSATTLTTFTYKVRFRPNDFIANFGL